MFMRGRCGFDVNCETRPEVLMRSGETPGKCSEKKPGIELSGEVDSAVNVAEGAKSVQVKERSREGIAMNMK